MNIMADRSNHRLNEEIERQIHMYEGTVHGQRLRNMYENGSEYEAICDVACIDYDDYMED